MNNSIFAVEVSLSEFFVHKCGACRGNEIKFTSKIETFFLVTLFLPVSSPSVLNNTFRGGVYTSSYHSDHIHQHKCGACRGNEIKFNSKIETFFLVTLFLPVSSPSVLNNTFRGGVYTSSYHSDHIHQHKCFIILTFNTHKIEFQCYNH